MTPLSSSAIHQAELLEKLRSRQALIGIVGLGYVGLPLSLTYASRLKKWEHKLRRVVFARIWR